MKPSVETIKTVSGSVRLATQYFANSVLGLVFFIFLARLVTKAELGVYAALMLSYGFFQTIGMLGLNVAAAHFVPKLLAEGKQEGASSAARTIILIGISSSIVISLAYFLLAPFLSLALTRAYTYMDLFRATSIAVLSVTFSVVIDGLMQGVREFSQLALIRLVGQVLRIAVSLALLLLGYGLIAVVVGWAVFGVTISLLPFPFLLRNISLRGHLYPFRPIWRYSSPILGSSLLNFFSGQIDIFILMLLALPVAVGGYNVALTASSLLLTLVLTSVHSTLLPTMSGAYGRGGIRAVEDVLKKASKYVALAYFPICIGLASLSEPAVWLMAGKVYHESIAPLAVLASSSLTYGMGMLIIIAMSSTGMTRRVLEIYVTSNLGGALSCALLIPILGIEGAAIGRGLLFAFMLGYGFYTAKKIMKVHFDSEAVWKSLLSSVLMGLLLVAFQTFHASTFMLPVYLLAGASTYALFLKVLNAINSYDLMILKEILPRKLATLVRLADKIYT